TSGPLVSLTGPALIERATSEAQATPAPAKPVSSTGDHMLIPAIGVDAAIESVGLDSQGKLASPSSPLKVGWYRLGSRPGGAGNAVFDGHLDWAGGQGVFWNLRQLAVGDRIMVHNGARQLTFQVSSSR